jgi:hypothetical protein
VVRLAVAVMVSHGRRVGRPRAEQGAKTIEG